MAEIWRESHPATLGGQEAPAPGAPGLLWAWWITYVLANLVDVAANLIELSLNTVPEGLILDAQLGIALSALYALAALLAIAVVHGVDVNQTRHHGLRQQAGE